MVDQPAAARRLNRPPARTGWGRDFLAMRAQERLAQQRHGYAQNPINPPDSWNLATLRRPVRGLSAISQPPASLADGNCFCFSRRD